MKLSVSRILGILSGVGAALSAIAAAVNIINPKWGAVLAAVGATIAMVTERAQGGVSVPEKRIEAAEQERKDEAGRD